MIRNRHNYLTPSVQDIKGKKGRTKRIGTTIETLQTESQKDSFFPKKKKKKKKNGQTAIQNKMLTRTYMQRHTMTEIVNHSRSTAWEPVSKIVYITGRGRGGGGGGA